MSIVGARPHFVKAAAVSRAFQRYPEVDHRLVHTGQHFDDDMSAVFFEELAIPEPAHHLGIHGGGHGEMVGRMLEAIERILVQDGPRLVVVYGDTNSTLAGALAAAKLHIPVAHVEAGLRSFNRQMPEEINRVVADHVSTLLFCPTINAVRNLHSEGISTSVHHVGDVMYDATLFARQVALRSSMILDRLGLEPNGYAVCTVHRAENTDSPARLATIMAYLEDAARERPVVFPVHPRTRQALARYGLVPKRLMLIDPLGYLDVSRLLASATTVFTDSGGLQKEAYFHGVPCITLRDETEWVETVTHGWNRLWQGPDFATPRRQIPDYGDGNAADRIIDTICSLLHET